MSFLKKILSRLGENFVKVPSIRRLLEDGYVLKKAKVGNFPEVEMYSKTLSKTGTTIDYVVGENGKITKKIVTPGSGNNVKPFIHNTQTHFDLNGKPQMATVNYRIPLSADPGAVGTSVRFVNDGHGFNSSNRVLMPVYHRFL